MADEPKSIFERAVEAFGEGSQRLKLAEECAELIVAIHHLRARRTAALYRFAEECADVEIMLEQMRTDGTLSSFIDTYKERKLRRLEETLLIESEDSDK